MIARWTTCFSDVSELYFEKLVFEDFKLLVLLKDNLNKDYSVEFQSVGPYLVIDEAFRSAYWQNKEHGLGWSMKVDNSDFIDFFKGESLLSKSPNTKHLVIASMDVIFEILSEDYPTIVEL